MKVTIESRPIDPKADPLEARVRWGVYPQEGKGARRLGKWHATELEAIRWAESRGLLEVVSTNLFDYTDKELGYCNTDPSGDCQLGFGFTRS